MKFKLLLLSFLSSIYVNAQSTKYRQAEDAILIKYGKEIGIAEQSLKDLLQKGDRNSAQQLFLKKFKTLPQYQIIEIGNRMEKDTETINDLRVEEDFKQLATVGYNDSDFFQIVNYVKPKYEKWKLKGEFEKTEDYHKRLKEENNFIKNEISEAITKITNNYSSNGDYNITSTPLDYNADKEILNYKFSWKDELIVWKGYIKASPEIAKQLKSGSGKLISSLRVKNAKQILQFSYYNIIPFNLEYIHIAGQNIPITLTTVPYGSSDGGKLFTKENLKINSTSYTGYTLVEYSNSLREEQVFINIDRQIESLATTPKTWDTSKSNEIKNEINNLFSQNPNNSTLIKLEQKLKNKEKKIIESIFREADSNIKRMDEYSLEIKRGGYKREEYLKAYTVNYNNTMELYNKAVAIDNTEEMQTRISNLNKIYNGVVKNTNDSNSKQNSTLKTLNKILK